MSGQSFAPPNGPTQLPKDKQRDDQKGEATETHHHGQETYRDVCVPPQQDAKRRGGKRGTKSDRQTCKEKKRERKPAVRRKGQDRHVFDQAESRQTESGKTSASWRTRLAQRFDLKADISRTVAAAAPVHHLLLHASVWNVLQPRWNRQRAALQPRLHNQAAERAE